MRCKSVVGRWATGALLLAFVSGCYEQHTHVVVLPDGSGRVTVTRLFRKPPLQAMLAANRGDGDGSEEVDQLVSPSPQDLGRLASLYGAGVRLSTSRALELPDARGVAAVYSVSNISTLRLPARLVLPSPGTLRELAMRSQSEDEVVQEDEATGEPAYAFAFEPGAAPLLHVRVPTAGETDDGEDPETEDDDAEALDELADEMPEMLPRMMDNGNALRLTGKETPVEFMARMMGGLRCSLTVEVRGAAATDPAAGAPARGPWRRTLLSYDGDALLAARPNLFVSLTSYGDDNWFEALVSRPLAKGSPLPVGVAFERGPEMRVTLTPPTP